MKKIESIAKTVLSVFGKNTESQKQAKFEQEQREIFETEKLLEREAKLESLREEASKKWQSTPDSDKAYNIFKLYYYEKQDGNNLPQICIAYENLGEFRDCATNEKLAEGVKTNKCFEVIDTEDPKCVKFAIKDYSMEYASDKFFYSYLMPSKDFYETIDNTNTLQQLGVKLKNIESYDKRISRFCVVGSDAIYCTCHGKWCKNCNSAIYGICAYHYNTRQEGDTSSPKLCVSLENLNSTMTAINDFVSAQDEALSLIKQDKTKYEVRCEELQEKVLN